MFILAQVCTEGVISEETRQRFEPVRRGHTARLFRNWASIWGLWTKNHVRTVGRVDGGRKGCGWWFTRPPVEVGRARCVKAMADAPDAACNRSVGNDPARAQKSFVVVRSLSLLARQL